MSGSTIEPVEEAVPVPCGAGTGGRWLTVIGDLVEDIVVWVDQRAGGGSVGTVVGTDNPATIYRSRGGSAANVAALAAGLTPTRFIGAVGDDPTGYALADQLRAGGVDVRTVHRGRTGTVVVIVDGEAERTMFPDRATAATLDHVPTEWLAGTAILHVPAYGLSTAVVEEAIRESIEEVRRLGARFTLDVSATSTVVAYGIDRFQRLLDELRPEFVFANADEAALLGLEHARPPEGCVFVIKRGARPVSLVFDDQTTVDVAAEHVSDVRDTTGAGDAFAAGFLSAVIGGAALDEACRLGHHTAARVLTHPGA